MTISVKTAPQKVNKVGVTQTKKNQWRVFCPNFPQKKSFHCVDGPMSKEDNLAFLPTAF